MEEISQELLSYSDLISEDVDSSTDSETQLMTSDDTETSPVAEINDGLYNNDDVIINPSSPKEECTSDCSVLPEPPNSTAHAKVHERWWTTLLAVLVSSLLAVLFGCSLGYPSPVLLELSELPNTELQFDVLLSDIFSGSGLVGGLFGGPPAGWVADKWGRKTALILNSIPYLVGYLMISAAYLITNGVVFKSVLIVGRFITGFGMGWSFLAVSVYIGEISSAKTRGIFGSFAELALVVGILSVYGIGSIPGFTFYHIALVMIAIVVLFVLTAVWLPETPRWVLLKTKNRKRAKSIMKLLRGTDSNDIDSELDDIQATIDKLPKMTLVLTVKEFLKQSILVPFIIVLVLMIYQELCAGGTTVVTYAAPIFKAVGVSNPDLISFCAIAGTQFLFTAIAVLIIDHVGRKILLAVSAFGMFVGSTMLGIYFFITRPSLCDNSGFNNGTSMSDFMDVSANEVSLCNLQYAPLAITSLVLFMASFSIGPGPVLWVLLTEYLPLHIRGTASGIIILANWVAAALVTGLYLSYADLVRPWFAWWTFSLISLLGLLFVVVFVVETKGKTLEQVQRMFEAKSRRT